MSRYFYAIMGMTFFRDNDSFHFGDLGTAMVTSCQHACMQCTAQCDVQCDVQCNVQCNVQYTVRLLLCR